MSDGYTALTRFIVVTVLSVVHAQLVFTVIVNKVSHGYTALTRFIVVTVLSVVHVQVVFTVIVSKMSDGYTVLCISWTQFYPLFTCNSCSQSSSKCPRRQ